MSKGREIHCYDYVNHPYEQVRVALSKDAPAVFQSATKAAASRAQSIASELRIDIGGIGIEADIRVSVKNIEVKDLEAMSGPATRLQLEWEAARMPRLFLLMKADLSPAHVIESQTLTVRYLHTNPMREMAIFSAVVFLAIASLLLCSCSDVDQSQSHQSHYSKIPGSGAVDY